MPDTDTLPKTNLIDLIPADRPRINTRQQHKAKPAPAERKLMVALRTAYQRGYSFSETVWRGCLLYTSPSPRDRTRSRMPSSA